MAFGKAVGPFTIQVRSGGQQMKLFYGDVERWIASKAGDRRKVSRSDADLSPDGTADRAQGQG